MTDLNFNNITLPEKPFKLGTTSFIFPDNIIPNVKQLGNFFDEIELLIFESKPEKFLPSRDHVKELLYLSQKHDLTYNIHLPTDVSLTCESQKKREDAQDTILKVIELFALINPTTYTLHLNMPSDINNNIKNQTTTEHWQDTTRKSLDSLVSRIPNPEIISIETLDYPFSFVEPFIEQFNLSVCIDVGHQIKYGHNLLQTFDKHKPRTTIMHLHGVDFSQSQIRDHTSLDKLPEHHMSQVKTILSDYTGVVSLEVFNLENLYRSLVVIPSLL
ncbi:cobamide remodeling phosphodiesterase CbiR [Desulfobacterales bacterium HSG17]|nr:cobamide remodeling phosphodiesterase CbiR [Desulfobacterales bacterium HSG17]